MIHSPSRSAVDRRPPPRTYWIDRILLAVLVAVAAWLALTLARGPGELAALWIGNGIVTGWVLSRRTARWPGYLLAGFLAELLARLLVGDAPLYALAIASCNLIEVLLVAGTVRRLVPDTRDPSSWMRLGGIATAATLAACAVSGVLAAAVAHAVHGQPFLPAFGGWFATHVVGMVVVATTTLVAHREGLGLFIAPRRRWSLAAILALLVAVAIVAMLSTYPVLFLTYPPLLLAAVRHRFAGVGLGVIALALVAAIATTLGHGPFQDLDSHVRIALLQLYIAGGCLMTLPMCLSMAERDRLAARLHESRLELERQSRVDALTHLANRRQFEERLGLALMRLHRHGTPVAVLCLDIDRFKAINDGHGHAAGDAVLQAFATRLGESVRETDLVARLGGDEFVILLEDQAVAGAEAVARKVLDAMATPVALRAGPLTVTTSIGIACTQHPTDPATLLAEADAALYVAKKAGRNRYHVARPG